MVTKIYEFLKIVDKDFPTPISDRVDLLEYANKMATLATVSAIFDEKEIIGLVALYCNDPLNKYAYIPLVAVHPKARGKKLSKALMQCAITVAKENGFKTIGIHTENPIAMNLYKSLNFDVKEEGLRKYLELEI